MPYIAHTLMDPTDTMRYSGTTALIVHSQSTEDLKFKILMERMKSSIPYQLRWRQMIIQQRNIKNRLLELIDLNIYLKLIISHAI
jgi:hypothetical protein